MEEAWYQGKVYVHNGHTWYEKKHFHIPPEEVQAHLNSQLSQLKDEIPKDKSPAELIDFARAASEKGQVSYAKRIVEEVLAQNPSEIAAVCLLSSLLRLMERPLEALRLTEGEIELTSELLLERALVLFDLQRFQEAERAALRSLELGQSEQGYALLRRLATTHAQAA